MGGTWIMTLRRTTLVVTVASSSELASSSPNSSVSSWKHGSRFVCHARGRLPAGSALYLALTSDNVIQWKSQQE